MKREKRISGNQLLFVGIVVVAIFSIFLFLTQSKKPLCPNCNVILIDIDVLRSDGLECFGYTKTIAPNLCTFSQRSLRFQRNITQSYWTMPSMFSTVTSLYVSAHKVRYALSNKLSPGVLTMAEILKSMGYRTIYLNAMTATGKWFLNAENGGMRGYDDITYQQNIDTWLPKLKELEKSGKPFFMHMYNQDIHMPYLLPENFQFSESIPKPVGFPLTDKDFNDALEDYLTVHHQEIFHDIVRQEHPEYFINPIATKQKLREYFQSLSNRYDLSRLQQVWTPIEQTYIQFVDGKKSEDRAYMRMLYDMKISLMDQKLGQFLDYLSSSPVKDNTIVVIMSDHGEAFGERGSFLHDDSQYNETIHTPLIIKIPGIDGGDIKTVTQNIDILPTIIETLGGRIIRQFQGISLLPLMKGQRVKNRVAVSEADTKNSIQDDQWKLITDKSRNPDSFELYDLARDPLETSNMTLADEKRANVYYKKLRSILDQADRQFEHLLPVFIDTEKRRKVMKEGYF